MRGNCCAIAMLSGLAVWGAGRAPAANREPIRVYTNETYVEDAMRGGTADISDPMAVFALVLRSLPERVAVYPTENYYYFRFMLGGIPYAGSIRFPVEARDKGRIAFGYYKDLVEWPAGPEADVHLMLDVSRGVEVQRVEDLTYRVSHAGQTVTFVLNDTAKVKPPPEVIGKNEKYLGTIFDESGVRFFFVFNERLKIFHYVLDETERLADELTPIENVPRILVGRRTGFAYYRDHLSARKILIGVYEPNSRVNNYFDGPFDQLPENFIEGEALREAIIASDPSAKGQIDRLGNYLSDEGRYLIHPYMLYRTESDLVRIDICASARAKRPETYGRCFVVAPEAEETRARSGRTPPVHHGKKR